MLHDNSEFDGLVGWPDHDVHMHMHRGINVHMAQGMLCQFTALVVKALKIMKWCP